MYINLSSNDNDLHVGKQTFESASLFMNTTLYFVIDYAKHIFVQQISRFDIFSKNKGSKIVNVLKTLQINFQANNFLERGSNWWQWTSVNKVTQLC